MLFELAYLEIADLVFDLILLYVSFHVGGQCWVELFNEKFAVSHDGIMTKVLLIEVLIAHENDEPYAAPQIVPLLLQIFNAARGDKVTLPSKLGVYIVAGS